MAHLQGLGVYQPVPHMSGGEIAASGWVSYRELYARSLRAAESLAGPGVGQGDRVDGGGSEARDEGELMKLAAPTVTAQQNLEEDLLFPPRYGQEIAEAIPGARLEVLP